MFRTSEKENHKVSPEKCYPRTLDDSLIALIIAKTPLFLAILSAAVFIICLFGHYGSLDLFILSSDNRICFFSHTVTTAEKPKSQDFRKTKIDRTRRYALTFTVLVKMMSWKLCTKISTFLKNLKTGQNVDGVYSNCNRDKQVELLCHFETYNEHKWHGIWECTSIAVQGIIMVPLKIQVCREKPQPNYEDFHAHINIIYFLKKRKFYFLISIYLKNKLTFAQF